MVDAGIVTLTAFISPYEQDRNKVRNLIGDIDFIEIYCKATLEVCERRDVKGLYKKARAGEIKNYTGIDSVYEAPKMPDLIIDTCQLSLEYSVEIVLKELIHRKVI